MRHSVGVAGIRLSFGIGISWAFVCTLWDSVIDSDSKVNTDIEETSILSMNSLHMLVWGWLEMIG